MIEDLILKNIKKKRIYTSKLDEYKNIIDEKLEDNNIPATGIYFLLKNKYGYSGKYGIVRKYVSSKKKSIISNLTIRFETIKGYQSQVDWKEKMKLYDIKGNEYPIITVILPILIIVQLIIYIYYLIVKSILMDQIID